MSEALEMGASDFLIRSISPFDWSRASWCVYAPVDYVNSTTPIELFPLLRHNASTY